MKAVLNFVFIITVCVPLLSQKPTPSKGKIDRFEDFKSQYIAARTVDIWLPEGYTPKKKYAVLYMHDGQMLFDSTHNWNKQEWQVDETMSHLMADKKIRDCIVVGIHNTKARHAEYFPQKAFESLPKTYQDSLLTYAKRNAQTGLFPDKIQSDNYLKFIVKELKPFVDRRYSTLSNKQNTFIAGSSMGGLISMYAICEYPSVFGGAACLSTHWIGTLEVTQQIPNAFMNYLKAHLPNPRHNKIYFDYGTATLDAFYPPFQKQADAIMMSKGFTSKTWITRSFEGEDHSEKAWAKRLNIPLEFLLKK